MAKIKSTKNTKYIFVVGGVMSGVGKGVATSSLGAILQAKGYDVTLMKADPYLNVDAGTMNPTEHGEVFVLDSGLETDQDMGNYERFLNKSLNPANYMTNGMVFQRVIDQERALHYEGKCVEYFYHIPQEITRRIHECRDRSGADIVIVEVGGTIGEYHNALFIEAGRLLKLQNPEDVAFVMVSFLPVPKTLGEMKTKPTQNAIQQLRSFGVSPDIIVARAAIPLDARRKVKIASFIGVQPQDIISAPDVTSIYDVPINFETDGLGSRVLQRLALPDRLSDMRAWKSLARKRKIAKEAIRIAVVGKYFDSGDFVLSDAYISVIEAIKFSSYIVGIVPTIDYLDAAKFETGGKSLKVLDNYDSILIPGGFGARAVEGKINVIEYARIQKIPYFGLCYGMQLLCVEYARHVANLVDAHTREIKPRTPHPVISVLEDQAEHLARQDLGGTMRLGVYPCHIVPKTQAARVYKQKLVHERHRHRYEVNPEYVPILKEAGLVFSGTSPDGRLMEIAELPVEVHPFFVGTQFHPEFLARPLAPHPLFSAFIRAARAYCQAKKSRP